MAAARLSGWLVIFIAMLAVTSHAASAKGPLGKVIINGPGLKTSVEVTDRRTLDTLDYFGALIDYSRYVDAPQDVEYYKLTYYLRDPAGNLHRSFTLPYHLDPDGGRGYVLDVFKARWHYTNPQADAALQHLLRDHGVSGAWSAMLPATGTAGRHSIWLIAVGSFLVLGGLLQIRRKPA